MKYLVMQFSPSFATSLLDTQHSVGQQSYLFASIMLQDSHKTRTKILGNIDPSKVSQSTVVVDPLEHQGRSHGKVSNTF